MVLLYFFFLFTDENCTYFRHFTPGQDAEIFEYKTQKGMFVCLFVFAPFGNCFGLFCLKTLK